MVGLTCFFALRGWKDFQARDINITIKYAVLLQGFVLVQQYLGLDGRPVTVEVVSRTLERFLSWKSWKPERTVATTKWSAMVCTRLRLCFSFSVSVYAAYLSQHCCTYFFTRYVVFSPPWGGNSGTGNTRARTFCEFCTTSIPVPELLWVLYARATLTEGTGTTFVYQSGAAVSSVRLPCCTRNFCELCQTSTPVPGTCVSSGQTGTIPWVPVPIRVLPQECRVRYTFCRHVSYITHTKDQNETSVYVSLF